MKKTNNKTKSPAPATNVIKPTKKKSPAETSLAPTTAPAVAAAPAAAPKPLTPAVKPGTSKPVATKIVARIDVGFGNALYVRGEGPGLSWTQGARMDCVANDQWELTLGESSRPISFKVLLNDTTWCTGPDAIAEPGATTTVTPEFP